MEKTILLEKGMVFSIWSRNFFHAGIKYEKCKTLQNRTGLFQ